MLIVIAKNQTASPIELIDLGLTVPASGQVTLSDFSNFFEISADLTLNSEITSGNILLSNSLNDFNISESLAYIDASGNVSCSPSGAASNAVIKLSDATGRFTKVTGVLIDDSNNLTTSGFIDANSIKIAGSAIDLGGLVSPVFADYYNSAPYAGITVTPSTIPLNSARQSSAAFVLSANEITTNTSGTYRVDCDLSFSDSSGDSTIEMWLELNGAEISGTRTRMFHDSSDESGGGHNMAIITFATNDVIRLRANLIKGTSQIDTLASGVRFMIHSIGSNGSSGADGVDGATGPTGPAGSGSTVNISEEGATISGGPYSNLNFIGDIVTASDSGLGVADITFNIGSSISAYDSTGGQTFTTSSTTINLDATQIIDSTYSLSSDLITINATGKYLITYDCSLEVTNNNRTQAQSWLEINSVEISGTRGEMYLRLSNYGASSSSSVVLNVTSGDIIRLRAARVVGGGTCRTERNGSRITIVRLS